MISPKQLFAFLVLFLFSFVPYIYGQEKNRKEYTEIYNINQSLSPDTIKNYRYLLQPDTINGKFINSKSDSGFTYRKYVDFLNEISDTSKYIVLPINEFIKTINPKKIIIGLRHDIDLDLDIAFNLSKVENNVGFRSTYFVLHTANYYLANPGNKAVHNELIIPSLKKMQNVFHHEIGWHNDLITLQLVYKIDPVIFLHQELSWLRDNGLFITGTASHGSNFCYTYKYVNWYFWKEFPNPNVAAFKNYESAIVGGETIIFKKAFLKDFDLDYEAYFINFNKYYSDASTVNGQRWNFGMLDLKTLHPGDRVQILMHPIYYSPTGSDQAHLFSFNLTGQVKSTINHADATIVAEMPADKKTDSLIINFTLSEKANAYIGRRRLVSGVSVIDCSEPVNLKIVAENGLASVDWTITVNQQPDSINQLPDSAGAISGASTVCQGQKSVTYSVPGINNASLYKWTLPAGATGMSRTRSIILDFGTSAVSDNITVKGINSYGAGAESTLPVEVKAKPLTSTITQSGNILLSDAIIGNQWYNQSGPINGATNQDYKIISNGDYYVIVTTDGCSSEPSNSISLLVQGTEIINFSKQIKIYPNPVLDELVIEIEGSKQQTYFEIINSGGQIILKGNFFEKTIIQTSNFVPGPYLIKLESGKTYEFRKIVKE
jgi:hypothetical protein